MKRDQQGIRRVLAFTLCGVLACSAIWAVALYVAQEVTLDRVEAVAEVAAPMPVMAEILAERVSPLTGLPLADDVPEGRRLTAIAVDGYFTPLPLKGLSEAGLVMEVVIDRHVPRLMALYDDYAAVPEVGPLRSARRQTFEPVLPFQPLLVSNGNNVWLNELLDEYEYEPLHIQYGEYLYRDGSYNMPGNVFTNGALLAAFIEKKSIDDQRVYNSSFFDFLPYGERRIPIEEDAGAVFLPLRVTDEEDLGFKIHHAAYFTLDEDGRYAWHRYDAAHEMVPAVDGNTDEVVAFDNIVILFADMGLMPVEEYSMVVEFHGGVGFYFNGGACETIRWRKGGPLEPLRLYQKDYESAYVLNPGTTYLAIADIEDADYFFIGEAGPYEDFISAYPKTGWW